ncbi:BBE domain-containing protein [Kribbella sp. NPDC051952]|uniref:BBE domain-containing protein n=1 Tax=Kribbella sp. NPDC051952 TaxID=3154851 RepID=UPI003439745A
MRRVLGRLDDVSGLQSVSITGDLVAVGPGVRLGPLADELAVLGRALPSSYAGTAAIALNGGLGPLARYHGLLAGVSGVLVGDDGGSIRFVLDELAGRIGRPPERTRIEPMVAGDTSYLRRFGGEELRRVKSEFFEHLLPRTAIEDLVAHWRDAAPGVFVHPWGSSHVYQTHPDPDLLNPSHAHYGSNLHRLIGIKAQYDPEWTFGSKQPLQLAR